MTEIWKPILGFEGRYEISDAGRVRSLSFLQRYLLRNGREAFRRTRERIVAQQKINSGYLIVHLHLDGSRYAKLVHRLVAVNFVDGFDVGRDVNHKDGDKMNNTAENLEWLSRRDNHLHAVALGLNKQAVPTNGYPSIAQAAKGLRKAHRTIRKQRDAA